MIIGDLDLGTTHPQRKIHTGMAVGSVVIYGARDLPFPINGVVKEIAAEIWCQTPGVIGGAAAGSSTGALYLAKQLEELAGNPDLQPTYVQWMSTGGAIVVSQDDGFFLLHDLQIDYEAVGLGTVHFSAIFGLVSPGPPNRIGMWSSGAALNSSYSGIATNVVAFPLNATSLQATFSRAGAEGTITLTQANSVVNPAPFVPSSTIADAFKGGCRVYDAMAVIGTNAVPAPPTAWNANWVEVKGPDHKFVGDVVITNGLHLYTFSPSVAPGVVCYLWNTALGTPGWQQFGSLKYLDNSNNAGTLRQVSFTRVGLEEIGLVLVTSTTAGLVEKQALRLQRGMYESRLDVTPQSQTNTNGSGVVLSLPVIPKIVYNSTNIVDTVFGPSSVPAATDYGYAAALITNNNYPFVAGFLYQNAPVAQPVAPNTIDMGFGENATPLVNATKTYGIFAFPWATPQNFQTEAESNVAAPWTNAVDATASTGHAAKLASGNVNANNQYQCNVNSTPPAGTYAFFVRVRTGTIGAGVNAEVQVFLQNSTQSTFAIASLTPASVNSTTYVWKLAGTLAFNGTDVAYFGVKANGTFTTTVDWFVDEVAMMLTTGNGLGPQDLFQQFIFDRSVKQVLA